MQDNYRQELTDRFINAVEYLNRRMHSGRLDEWHGQDITIPQIKTLVLLEQMGPLRMGVIANRLGTTLSAMTSIVDRLVEKNLVDRDSDPSDRRVVLCKLTDQGREETKRFWRVGREKMLKTLAILEETQLESVVQALELLRQKEEELFQMTFDATQSID